MIPVTLHNKIISRINSEYDVLMEESDIDCIIRNEKMDYEETKVTTDVFSDENVIRSDGQSGKTSGGACS